MLNVSLAPLDASPLRRLHSDPRAAHRARLGTIGWEDARMTIAERAIGAHPAAAASPHRCFLCALDTAPCALPMLEGTLAHVVERAPRTGLPAVTLDGAD